MTDHFLNIYHHKADLYERMVGREDQRGNLFAALTEIHPLDGATVVDFGAGTGRMTRLTSLLARRVYAFDFAPAMISEAQRQLEQSGYTNWRVGVADNRAMPLKAGIADVVVEGWSFAHTVAWSPEDWRGQIGRMLEEMKRLLRPNGVAILLETMGTGNKQPAPPTEGLAELYQWWEQEQGFEYRWVRTDYQFESVQEADELTRFFFGDELADKLVKEQTTILPECTGIWWRRF